jgi:hypothetical protein
LWTSGITMVEPLACQQKNMQRKINGNHITCVSPTAFSTHSGEGGAYFQASYS